MSANTKVPEGKRYVCSLLAFEAGQTVPADWRGKGRLVDLPDPVPAAATTTWRHRRARLALARSSAEAGCLVDELVDALVAKGVITLDDLPKQARDTLEARRLLRRELEDGA